MNWTEQKLDTAINNLVRGAAIEAIKEAQGLDAYSDDFEESVFNKTLSGLSDGSIRPLTEAQFDREFYRLQNRSDLAGFFSSIKRAVKKVGGVVKKLQPKPIRRITSRVARRLKPIVKKVAPVALLAAGVYFGYPYAAKFVSGMKAKFLTGLARKKVIGDALNKARKMGAPAQDIATLETEYVSAARQAAAETAKKATDPAWYEKYWNMAKREMSAVAQQALSPSQQRDVGRGIMTEELRTQGIDFASPASQNVLDLSLQAEQQKRGQPTGTMQPWMMMLPVAAMAFMR